MPVRSNRFSSLDDYLHIATCRFTGTLGGTMAAFETTLVAIGWRERKFVVISQIIAQVDSAALRRDGLLRDVSENVGYIDEAALVQPRDFERYLLPESNSWHDPAKEWYQALPKETTFILVHLAEWESGLGD
ncbi:MAG: hypothetical protein ABI654_02795 [Betaproteobacteria bacterium]